MNHDNGLRNVYQVRCFSGPHVTLQERYNVALLDSLALQILADDRRQLHRHIAASSKVVPLTMSLSHSPQLRDILRDLFDGLYLHTSQQE